MLSGMRTEFTALLSGWQPWILCLPSLLATYHHLLKFDTHADEIIRTIFGFYVVSLQRVKIACKRKEVVNHISISISMEFAMKYLIIEKQNGLEDTSGCYRVQVQVHLICIGLNQSYLIARQENCTL